VLWQHRHAGAGAVPATRVGSQRSVAAGLGVARVPLR
jgi:hypothetical protein